MMEVAGWGPVAMVAVVVVLCCPRLRGLGGVDLLNRWGQGGGVFGMEEMQLWAQMDSPPYCPHQGFPPLGRLRYKQAPRIRSDW